VWPVESVAFQYGGTQLELVVVGGGQSGVAPSTSASAGQTGGASAAAQLQPDGHSAAVLQGMSCSTHENVPASGQEHSTGGGAPASTKIGCASPASRAWGVSGGDAGSGGVGAPAPELAAPAPPLPAHAQADCG
jgi:hypothetical protein